jgi:signal transduction histidine kinase
VASPLPAHSRARSRRLDEHPLQIVQLRPEDLGAAASQRVLLDDAALQRDHVGRGVGPGDVFPARIGVPVVLDLPISADPVVQHALADNNVHSDSDIKKLTVAVPITDATGVTFAVRAATFPSEVYPGIALTWLGMIALEAVILTAIWQLARRQARGLARPVETLATAPARLGDGDFTVRAQPSGIPEIDTAATALNRAAARIADLVDRERAVTANASHQLRTPLAGLRLRLETALDTPGADFRTATHEAIAAQAHRTEPLDIPALLNELEATWHGPLAEIGRALSVTADPLLRPSRVSTAAIRQILAVLIDNAARHGTGHISVHARETSDNVAIDVSDEGPGPGIDHTGLFDHPAVDGHGLGLPLARGLAEAEGGRLLLTPRAPTTFTLFLPEHDGG